MNISVYEYIEKQRKMYENFTRSELDQAFEAFDREHVLISNEIDTAYERYEDNNTTSYFWFHRQHRLFEREAFVSFLMGFISTQIRRGRYVK